MPDWMDNLVQQPLYQLEQTVAQVTWGINRAMLFIVDVLDRFREQLVTTGFTRALDTVSTEILGISRPVVELSLTVGMLLIIATPIIKFQWVNIKKVLGLAVIVPLLLPMLAGGFQDIDAARSDLGSLFYNQIFSGSSFNIAPSDAAQGTERGILVDGSGQIPAYGPRNDGRSGLRGVDIAASYLWATRADVMESSRLLPTAFEQQYFPYDIGQFGDQESATRWELIERAGGGITRTVYGLILVAFAFLETLINLAFTLALGFQLIALIIATLFMWFTPFEGMVVGIIKKMADLMLQSWGISAVQGLTLAAVVSAANQSGSIAVLGVGILGLALEIVYVTVAYKAVIGAITGMGSSSGGISSVGRALAPAAALATGGASAVLGGALAAPKAALAYQTARQSGVSSSAALGYAAQSNRPLAAIGNLATMMGYGNSEYTAGAAIGQNAKDRRYGMHSPMARHQLGMHADREQQRTERTQDRQVAHARQQQQEADRHHALERQAQQAMAREQAQARQAQQEAERQAERQKRMAREAYEAPIKAIGRPQIAEAMTNAYASAYASDPTTPANVDSVTNAIGLAPGAFGYQTAAIQTVLDDLHATPFAPDLAQRLMVEAGQEGQFRPETRAEAQHDLMASGMTEAVANRRMQTMERHMQRIPSGVKVSDAEAAAALQQQPSSYAGYSAEHRQRPSEREPVITPTPERIAAPPPAALRAPTEQRPRGYGRTPRRSRAGQ